MTTARDAIAQGYKVFEKAYFEGDADTISRMYTDTAELLVPETPTIRGREAIAQVWKTILGAGGNRVRVNIREVEENGDWAFEVGAFEATAQDGRVLGVGKYIVIWKRSVTGAWKIHRDIFNSDMPSSQTT